MRLFFAFDLDDAAREAVGRVAEQFAERLARAREPRAVKWVERENLHVTLRFLGEVGEAAAAVLIEKLTVTLEPPVFTLELGRGGCFPPAGPPRVAWIGVSKGADGAQVVFEHLDRLLAPLGFEPEGRGYTPHVTLGRVRDITRQNARALRGWLEALPSCLASLTVREVVVYRSHLGPSGPRYEPLRRAHLSST
jgi:2'-5' RNA ligase